MRTQVERDRVTLVIATALLRFLAVVAGGLLALFLARTLVGGDWFVDSTLWPLCVLAGVVAVVHLYRHRRP